MHGVCCCYYWCFEICVKNQSLPTKFTRQCKILLFQKWCWLSVDCNWLAREQNPNPNIGRQQTIAHSQMTTMAASTTELALNCLCEYQPSNRTTHTPPIIPPKYTPTANSVASTIYWPILCRYAVPLLLLLLLLCTLSMSQARILHPLAFKNEEWVNGRKMRAAKPFAAVVCYCCANQLLIVPLCMKCVCVCLCRFVSACIACV